MRVLVVNAGSSSLKVDIVEDGEAVEFHDGLPAVAPKVDAVGHRIVHGGPDLVRGRNRSVGGPREPTVVEDAADVDCLAACLVDLLA